MFSCRWLFTSLVHFWPPPIFNPGYAYFLCKHKNWVRYRVRFTDSLLWVRFDSWIRRF